MTQWHCPDCRVALQPLAKEDDHAPGAMLRDPGASYTCPTCNKSYAIWPSGSFVRRIVLAIFSLWFGLFLLQIGGLALSFLLGLPARFGYPGREIPEGNETLFIMASVIGISGGILALLAFLPAVIRQFLLRRRLSRKPKQTLEG